jgi:hypothetical protein
MSEWIGDECDPQAISVDTPTSVSPHAPLMASSPRISQQPRLGRLAEKTRCSNGGSSSRAESILGADEDGESTRFCNGHLAGRQYWRSEPAALAQAIARAPVGGGSGARTELEFVVHMQIR